MLDKLQPNRVVLFEDNLYLVEAVQVEVTMQRIERRSEEAKAAIERGEPAPCNPVFVRLRGDILDPNIRALKPLDLPERA